MGRRALLSAAARGGVGVAALALVGCGGDDDAPEPASPSDAPDPPPLSNAPPSLQIAPTAGTPQSGGALRLHASLTALDSFDIHRSTFAVTQRFAALQQNRLLRFADADRGRIESDLARMPELPDDLTYVLELDPAVRWWTRDPTGGRPLIAADVKANIDRQIVAADEGGDPDPLFLRREVYRQTEAVEALDEATVVLRTKRPVANYMSQALAGPWAFIQAPEIWESFGDRLRDTPLDPAHFSGTGPFEISRFLPADRITFRRNPTYFRSNVPYLDAIDFLHLADAGAQEAAFREGSIDAWTPGDPDAVQPLLQEFNDLGLNEHGLAFPVQVALSLRESAANPFRDRRVAQALSIALDRRALLARAYGDHAGLSAAAPWFADGWALSHDDLTQQPGYRPEFDADQQRTARDLLDAAGFTGALPLTIVDLFEATYPGVGELLRETLTARLGVNILIERADLLRTLEGLGDGSVPAVVGWGEAATEVEPTADLLRTAHSGGADNVGGYVNPTVDSALDQMQTTFDIATRQAIFRETVQPALLADPTWQLTAGHGISRTVHAPEVHLPQFGFGWDGHRFELAWRSPGTT